jgi:hypothetical protein
MRSGLLSHKGHCMFMGGMWHYTSCGMHGDGVSPLLAYRDWMTKVQGQYNYYSHDPYRAASVCSAGMWETLFGSTN